MNLLMLAGGLVENDETFYGFLEMVFGIYLKGNWKLKKISNLLA